MSDIASLQRIMDAAVSEIEAASIASRIDFLQGDAVSDPLYLRLVRSLRRACMDGVGQADLLALVRQAQLRVQWRLGVEGADPSVATLRVAEDFAGVRPQQWVQFGLDAVPIGGARLRITPKPWRPAWLDEGAERVVGQACAELERRRPREVPADPIVSHLHPGHTSYRCAGQRESVRAAFLSPPCSTTIVSLPTGAGKSLAFQVPGLVAAKKRDGTVVVVVPTVALAIDQATRFKQFAHEAGARFLPSVSLAYHGGLTEGEKSEIQRGIRDGTLPIVFTSPEACAGALAFSLRSAATAGYLRLFAVDEAHIVSSWGEGFRPSFQAVAGLRDQLLDMQRSNNGADRGFRTLLLSATLTPEATSTLQRLFGARNPDGKGNRQVEIVAEVALRPEPSYLRSGPLPGAQRQQNLLEAIHHLPRPLILYVTTREQAEEWLSVLHRTGFSRVEKVVGGDMAERHGQDVLHRWHAGSLDIVVATSAFGLGVDQSHVRTVIHACVPESVDRFYQEVGRGGRDGRSCVSLLAWTEEDVRIAESLARETEISAKRGHTRWQAMRTYRPKHLPNDVLGVSLDALPPDLTTTNERNRSWNFKTLLRMARAGFIEFSGMPDIDGEIAEKMTDADWEEHRSYVALRVLDDRHSNLAAWTDEFESVRADSKALRTRTIDGFRRVIKGDVPLHELFRKTYEVPAFGISVAASAGDCPVTRSHQRESNESPSPIAVIPENLAASCGRRLDNLFKRYVSNGPLWVTYDYVDPGARSAYRDLQGRLQRLFLRLAGEGVVAFSAPEALLHKSWEQLAAESPWGFVIRGEDVEDDPLSNTTLPTVTVLSEGAGQRGVRSAAVLERERHVILVPSDEPHPTHPNRRVSDLPHLTLQQLEGWLYS